MTQATSDLTNFQWSPQPQAAALVQELVDEFLRRCPGARKFAERLSIETGTRFLDWIAWILYPLPLHGQLLNDRLSAAGFESDGQFWRHPAGLFPLISTQRSGTNTLEVAIKTDSIVNFLVAQGIRGTKKDLGWGRLGKPWTPVRAVRAFAGDAAEMWAVELHGHRHHVLKGRSPAPEHLLECSEMFRLRLREFEDPTDGFAHAADLIDRAVDLLGAEVAADLFFAAEREYWMSRNRAARVQYARQQGLGLGWANHDHHTYRSSREHFKDLVVVMEKLGLVCRERFYAGQEAGWGAQVMEQPNAGIVVFADVDLSPEEVTGDFAHEPLAPRKKLGTVGLWCKLHGEAFLEAGMHHLECQFDFAAAREQLKEEGVNSMKPFTDFDYLKQAFTEGQMWPVDPRRIEALLREGQITPEQAEKFRREGALGSHLEVLQRDEGYKGFNQTGISEIIRKTDPRFVDAQAARSE